MAKVLNCPSPLACLSLFFFFLFAHIHTPGAKKAAEECDVMRCVARHTRHKFFFFFPLKNDEHHELSGKIRERNTKNLQIV